MGLVMAFMSSLQLKQLGATVYVAALVAIAMAKELGPLLTAILVAGRSGSAFAAEIGTMVVNEEVDALSVMGFDPIRFLAVPKVLAAMLVMPLLTAFSTFVGILGGLIIGVTLLDITVYTYINESKNALALFDLTASLVKSVVFAATLAGIGCQRGFQVRGGAAAVGAATTSAVVAGIFLIVIIDSVFAIVLHYIR
jgi:phospholipid/cholesterol/gamma-HCH transport system permease protein